MNMSRRKMRETIFRLLFPIEFNTREELTEQTEYFFSKNDEIGSKDRRYIEDKLDAILDRQTEIDEKISSICEGWRIERIGKAELSIMRLAVYEILEDADIPVKVAINEAVELSKIYCDAEAPRFVNGVLAKLA